MSSLWLIGFGLWMIFGVPQGMATSFYDKHQEGWHWYEKRPEPLKEEEMTAPQLTPSQQIEVQKKALEAKLHKAVVSGNPRDVLAYIKEQKKLMDQSETFAKAWQVAILTHPEYDERVKNPQAQYARHGLYEEQQKVREKMIKGLSKEYGLFFFFKKDCHFCHGFAPIVEGFSRVYGWDVLPITLDGGSLPEFPNAKPDNGISKELGVTVTPALVAVHGRTGKMIPLAYGAVSLEEIERRVETLITHLQKTGEFK